jgi:serine/threonine protein kinase/uncharacterized protein with WD repeat
MKQQTLCPEPDLLRKLLAGNLPAEEQAEVTRHLDQCTSCPQVLEELATEGARWSQPARRLGVERPPANSAYWLAVKKVENEATVLAGVVEAPEVEDEPVLDFLSPTDKPGNLGRLDHFEIVELLGRGGMGVVLKAFDECLQRYVAIKVLSPKVASNQTARKRFCREARAAAAVRHDHVVAIHTVDESEGNPYLVMEYIPGVSLQERIDRDGRLELEDIVRIAMQTASGLAAAHAQGLIHRDVKPGNILLETGNDRVKITDFGLARADEDVRLTQSGVVAGTPQYMAPEQAEGKPLDHRADLFSLGSVMYAMATGKAPFEASSALAMLLAITKDTPRSIQQINPTIPDWLVEIIDTLLAKDSADRFQSAAELANLLDQHLAHLQKPTKVPLPCSLATRARRLRRRRWITSAVPLLLLGGLVSTEATGMTHVTSWLASILPGQRAPAPVPPRATLAGHAGPIWSVAFSPDGKTLAMALDTGAVKLWDPETGKIKLTLPAHKKFPIWSVAFSPDGRLMATGSDEGTVKLWDTKKWTEKQVFKTTSSVRPLAFGGKGLKLVTGTRDGKLKICNLAKHEVQAVPAGHLGVVMAVAFSADGKTVASASGDETVVLWNAETGQQLFTLQGHGGGVWAVAFSPDSKLVAAGGWDHHVRLWDVASGDLLATLEGHTQDVWSVAFSRDGKTLASGSGDRIVKLWDVASRKEVVNFAGHGGTIYTVAFSPDGKTVASGSRDGTIKLWSVPARD